MAATTLLLGATAGCSDDFARLGNGAITTASLGLEQPSNQDRIIRKADGGAGIERPGIRPASAPQQSYPGDAAATTIAEPARTYAAPAVTSDALPPLEPSEPAADVTAASAVEQVDEPEVRAKPASREITRPKLAAAGIPVVPPAPQAPGGLRKIGEPLTTGTVEPRAKAVARKAVEAPGGGYTVVSGDTVYAIARRYGTTSRALMEANGMATADLRIGQRLAIPGRAVATASPATRTVRPAVVAKPATVAPVAVAKSDVVTGSVPRATATPVAKTPAEPAKAAPAKVATAAKASAGFAWPARGRILASFGQRTPSGTNDGVDIALPVGTAVKAAADGIVLYSGSELKKFGNLVLVRHDDGWVSAYANTSANLVKRGERVARGQTIARSGKSGQASEPQLHFELRRNSKPVDPQNHLKG